MDRQAIVEFLKNRPRLSAWSLKDLEKLAADIEVLEYRAGQSIFAVEYEADDGYLLNQGKVLQSIYTISGEEWSTRTINPGDFFMQQALFRGQGHASAARALADSVVFRLPAAVLAQVLTDHPDLWSIIQSPAAARLQAMPLLRSLDDDQIQQLAVSTEAREFKAGAQICSVSDREGCLWLVDWGQVRITEQAQTELSGGRPTPTPPTSQAIRSQGFTNLPQIVTAGNWFVGGQVTIPHLLAVSAEAVTNCKLFCISGPVVEVLAQRFPDLNTMLYHRLDIAARLEEALARDELFRDFGEEHWQDLATIAGWEHVPSNLDVTRQGQYGTRMYVLSEGAAIVRSTDESGRERPRHIIHKGANDYYGVDAMLRGARHDATVRSMVDTGNGGSPIDGSDWLTVQKDDLRYVLQSDPGRWRHTGLWHVVMEAPKRKTYRWQEVEEDVVLATRRHVFWLVVRLVVILAAALMLSALAMGLLELFGAMPRPLSIAMTFLALFLPPLFWFVNDYFNDYYVITNQRVLRHDRVFLIYENQLEAPLQRIQDIQTKTSLLAKILNYGFMELRTAGLGNIPFDMIPDPEYVESTIRGLQGAVKAGTKAEQRENLRHKMLSGLKMRLTPSTPARSLPEGTQVPVQHSGLPEVFHNIRVMLGDWWHWLTTLPGRIYLGLVHLLPGGAERRILKEREAKAKRRAAQMQDVIVHRKHVIFLIKAAAIPIIVLALTFGMLILTPVSIRSLFARLPTWLEVPYTIFVLICLFWLWYRIENWRNDKYILTRTHIIDIYALPLGLFEQRRQAEWEKVQNANYEIPDFWANLLNYGNVLVETASVEGRFDFLAVPNPRKVQQEVVLRIGQARQVAEQRERERRQADLSETLEIYNELLQEWRERNQVIGSPAPPGPLAGV
jgi:CRP-like cAMP-binding protein/uncharacterized membrane protein YdbT with pleckstrin-like domain